MPRWIERRGYTLCPPEREAAGHFVRLSLMERAGLVPGWFNVREARARVHADDEPPELLSTGRALSWRWLREREAERLLDERLSTMEAMGYTVLGSVMGTRGRWDWLYDLVHRRLAASAAEPGTTAPCPSDALRDALSRLGLSPDAVLEGIAAVLGLSVTALQEPDARVARSTDPEQVAVLLPFLLHHERPEVRAVGERWFALPAVLYQLPADTLMHWLESDTAVARLLAERLEDEGPALLGPDRLHQLGRGAPSAVRDAAKRWSARLG
ncbi:MAG: hypothetical protein AAGA54_22650 [Myxococcota bacterium]